MFLSNMTQVTTSKYTTIVQMRTSLEECCTLTLFVDTITFQFLNIRLLWVTYLTITKYVSITVANFVKNYFPYLLWTHIHMSVQVHFQVVLRPHGFTWLNEPKTNMKLFIYPLLLPTSKKISKLGPLINEWGEPAASYR